MSVFHSQWTKFKHRATLHVLKCVILFKMYFWKRCYKGVNDGVARCDSQRLSQKYVTLLFTKSRVIAILNNMSRINRYQQLHSKKKQIAVYIISGIYYISKVLFTISVWWTHGVWCCPGDITCYYAVGWQQRPGMMELRVKHFAHNHWYL